MGVYDVEALEARATVEQPQESGTADLWVGGFSKDVDVWGRCGNVVYLIAFTETYKLIIQLFKSRIPQNLFWYFVPKVAMHNIYRY